MSWDSCAEPWPWPGPGWHLGTATEQKIIVTTPEPNKPQYSTADSSQGPCRHSNTFEVLVFISLAPKPPSSVRQSGFLSTGGLHCILSSVQGRQGCCRARGGFEAHEWTSPFKSLAVIIKHQLPTISGSSLLGSSKSLPQSAQARLCRGCVEFADERTWRLTVSLLFSTSQVSNGDVTAFHKPLRHQDMSALEVRRGLGSSPTSVGFHNLLSTECTGWPRAPGAVPLAEEALASA